MSYKEFICGEDWAVIRRDIIRSRGSFCEKCHCWFPPNRLQVHHKSYSMEFGHEKESDLMVLCQTCHKELHQDLIFFNENQQKPLENMKNRGEFVIKSSELV